MPRTHLRRCGLRRAILTAVSILSLLLPNVSAAAPSPALAAPPAVAAIAAPRAVDAPQPTSAPSAIAGPGRLSSAIHEGSWLASVQDGIRRSEYHITWQSQTALADLPAAYQAPNRAHNLRSYFTPQGLRLIPRQYAGDAAPWQMGLALAAWGAPCDLRPAAAATLAVQQNRITYQRAGLSAWFANDERGLEHSFTIASPPATCSAKDPGEITLDFALSGNLAAGLSADGQAVDFTTAGGVRVLRLGELLARDAAGRELAVQLVAPTAGGLRVVVAAGHAAYPLTFSILLATPNWTAESNQEAATFGYAAGTAGDVNGDGYSDVVIGAHGYDNGEDNEGRAFVFLGSAAGPSLAADWTAEGDQAGANFGSAVSTAGDVNGDGYDDILIGAPSLDNGESNEGAAFVYHGSEKGLSVKADWMVESNQADAFFAQAAQTAGDVNHDGYDDVIIGAPSFSDGEDYEGAAFAYHGSSAGLATSAAWSAQINQAYAAFGSAVVGAGDSDGDSFADVIVGAPYASNGEYQEGQAFVYRGSADGLAKSADWSAEGEQAYARFGFAVGTAGDVNGDGYSDVIAGAIGYDDGQTDEGRASLYYGSADGLAKIAGWTAESDQDDALFGTAVGTAGDVNKDGFADVIVGAAYYDLHLVNEGRTFVYLGSAGGLSAVAGWTAHSGQGLADFGFAAGTAGDVNGDGYSDIIVGAHGYSNGQASEGRAFIYYGSLTGLPAGADWTGESDQGNVQFGFAAGTAGDVNGDGYSDAIVGAPYYDNGQIDEGRAFVFHGSAAGLSVAANWTAESDQMSAFFGWAVGTAGDVNGDGHSDAIMGAPYYDNGQVDEGRAFVFHGSAAGLSAAANWTAESDQAGAYFGWAVGAAGDVNGDGYGDVIAGAPYLDNGQADEGAIAVYHGSAAGLSAVFNWAAESNQVSAVFGWAVATAGDVNGDGYSDVIAGAPYLDNGQLDEGAIAVYHGSAAGLSAVINGAAESNQAGALLGWAVGTAGDVNGDDYSDAIAGAPGYDNGQTDEGRAYVYFGSFGGLAPAGWSAEGEQDYAGFATAVAAAGDVNGDGYGDLVVGAPGYSNGGVNGGRVFVYHGQVGGPATTANWTAESYQANASFGYSVATAGDVNGDGYADIIAGAPFDSNGQTSEGRAYVFHGAGSGLAAIDGWGQVGDQGGDSLGFGVGTAGDVNGDGYSDVIIGAPSYDNGQTDEGRAYVYYGSAFGLSKFADWSADGEQVEAYFGYAVGAAGDVNGDGYSDVIVSAAKYDNGQTDEGRAYVYYGSAGGLSATANWSAEANQASAYFGWAAGTAGDVNGDGFADVIVSAVYYDNGEDSEGGVFVYYGSASGLSAVANWTAEGNQAIARFGWAIGTAGDVNGDGYSDVIAGALHYDNGQTDEGRAFVYHGSAAGLSAAANWTAESDQAYAYFGVAAGTAGDVNGDGYSDVIVGASHYDDGETDEGAAFVYHGSAGGLSSFANWRAESDQADTDFGDAVGAAGDVNGDGYSDVIAGAYRYDNGQADEGAAFVYYGAAGGLSATADWTAESDQASAMFGASVGTAGDVNGDGYSDVLVGATGWDGDVADVGRVYLYNGNGGPGLSQRIQQRRRDDSAPIDRLGRTDSVTQMRMALLGRIPFGTGKVKLEWEIKPLGVAFNGTGVQRSATWQNTGTAGVALNELAGGLAANTAYHWRARVLYHQATTPLAQHSRWFSPFGNGWSEQDLRTASFAVAAVPLTLGWNLISLPLAPMTTTVTGTLASINGSYDLVYAYRAFDVADPWKKYNTSAPGFLNDLTVITESMGLWLHAIAPATLTVTGTQPVSPAIPLTLGWNLVGYPVAVTQPVTIALASCAGSYNLVYGYDAFDGADPWKKYNTTAPGFLNDLTHLAPGRGYWINASAPCQWRP